MFVEKAGVAAVALTVLGAGAFTVREIATLTEAIVGLKTGATAAESRLLTELKAVEERQAKALKAVEEHILAGALAAEERQAKALKAAEERQAAGALASELRLAAAIKAAEERQLAVLNILVAGGRIPPTASQVRDAPGAASDGS